MNGWVMSVWGESWLCPVNFGRHIAYYHTTDTGPINFFLLYVPSTDFQWFGPIGANLYKYFND